MGRGGALNAWAARLTGCLAPLTLDCTIFPGQLADVGPAHPSSSSSPRRPRLPTSMYKTQKPHQVVTLLNPECDNQAVKRPCLCCDVHRSNTISFEIYILTSHNQQVELQFPVTSSLLVREWSFHGYVSTVASQLSWDWGHLGLAGHLLASLLGLADHITLLAREHLVPTQTQCSCQHTHDRQHRVHCNSKRIFRPLSGNLQAFRFGCLNISLCPPQAIRYLFLPCVSHMPDPSYKNDGFGGRRRM